MYGWQIADSASDCFIEPTVPLRRWKRRDGVSFCLLIWWFCLNVITDKSKLALVGFIVVSSSGLRPRRTNEYTSRSVAQGLTTEYKVFTYDGLALISSCREGKDSWNAILRKNKLQLEQFVE